MKPEKITIQTSVSAEKKMVWDYYTNPEHIIKWNFADSSWHCPTATNDLVKGGRYFARMEAKDGSFGFDFEAVYIEIKPEDSFTYEFDGRLATVHFKNNDGKTEVSISFDPESENPIELQRKGWQSILENFKSYVETN